MDIVIKCYVLEAGCSLDSLFNPKETSIGCYTEQNLSAAMHVFLMQRHLDWIYFEGFSNAEAEMVMKKNSRQIKNLLYRAKNALKSELDKEGFVYEEL